MKTASLCISIMALCLSLAAAQWQTITNTSHVYDLLVQADQIYFSSWGGVMQISPPANGADQSFSNYEQKAIWTTADGLTSNDVRNIEFIGFSQSLWFGSAFNGISIVSPVGIQQVNTGLGMPSNNVSKIIEHGSEILVATSNGLASFYYLEGLNFPLMSHQYSTQTTNGGLLSNQIGSMVLAANDYLYLSSTAGINFVHLDSLAVNSAWHHFNTTETGTGYASKLTSNANKLLVAAPRSVLLHSIDPWESGWDYLYDLDGLLNKDIASACIDDQNTVWVSYGAWEEEILSYASDTDTLLTRIETDGTVKHWSKFEAGLGDKTISKIVSHDGSIYLCSWGDGVYRLEGDHWIQFIPNSIGFPNILSITTDHSNAVWFASGNYSHIPYKKSALGASRYKDGIWSTLKVSNSPIHSDNILSIAVDNANRKWFGTYDVNYLGGSPLEWRRGVSIWDESTDTWEYYLPAALGGPLVGGTTVHIGKDLVGNMLVACFDDGFSVFAPGGENVIATFRAPNSPNDRYNYSYHNGRQYFIGTYNDPGLVIWNHNSIPVTGGEHWLIPPPADLNACEVFGVVTVQSPYEGLQHWIAASTGLFMWDEEKWYKYDTAIKRYVYNSSTGLWDSNGPGSLLYYADEERLYGSVRTTPTAIYLDPFNRIWIGSLENGISMYEPATERFSNYFQANSPLLSNHITALGYSPEEGLLMVGTPDGLNTLKIGYSVKPATKLEKLKIYPNPYSPDTSSSLLQISNFPSDILPKGENQCRIYDSSGALVIKLTETKLARFEWNGSNAEGKKCSSGIYFVVVTDATGEKLSGRIALIRN